MLLALLIVSAVASLAVADPECECSESVTRVSGTHAPTSVCAGELIFEDTFDEFDLEKWQHENTLAGGGNWEFQWYNNNRTNSYTEDGVLYITPSLLSDQYGEDFLYSGTLNVEGGSPADRCTVSTWFGCERTGTTTNIVNPIKSARIKTFNSFTFRYGRVEVRAKMPAGDWLWPAIWMMPANNAYGTWPSSGEIDLVESRGNLELYSDGNHIGTEAVQSTLHFGPYPALDSWDTAYWSQRNTSGYNAEFHKFQFEWAPTYLAFGIDDVEIGRYAPGEGGFWELGEFSSIGDINNPWEHGTIIAPFDQEFYLIMNLAVGGTTGFFPDNVTNPTPKPWINNSTTSMTDFWEAKDDWLPTWNLDTNKGKDASLQVDYVRVWAL